MTNESRLRNLFTYLDGLTALNANDYRCNNEIAECIKAIREELALEKASKVITPDKLRWMLADGEVAYPITVNLAVNSDADIRKVAAQLSERIAREGGKLA